jgi:hypothetical protein
VLTHVSAAGRARSSRVDTRPTTDARFELSKLRQLGLEVFNVSHLLPELCILVGESHRIARARREIHDLDEEEQQKHEENQQGEPDPHEDRQ